jgi:hypothetical protein
VSFLTRHAAFDQQVKQGFRLMTGLFGGLFILSQIAHHKGYVSVNMDKVCWLLNFVMPLCWIA